MSVIVPLDKELFNVHNNVREVNSMNYANLYINATHARNTFFDLLEKVKRGPYPITITVKGIPEAVIVSKEDYDSWMATIETISDPELMESIRKSDEDLKAGRYTPWEDVKKELGLTLHDKGKTRYVSSNLGKRSKKRSQKTR